MTIIKLIAFISGICIMFSTEIPMTKDISKKNRPNPKNDAFKLFFESDFSDSINITYSKKIIFKEYVKTVRSLEVAKEVCSIEKIVPNEDIRLTINDKRYHFKPIKGYRYYYFSKVDSGVGVVYSNIL